MKTAARLSTSALSFWFRSDRASLGDLGDHFIEGLAHQLGEQSGDSLQLGFLDLFDLDPEPRHGIGARFDVHSCRDLEPELANARRMIVGAADPFRDRAGDRGAELSLHLAGSQEPPPFRVNGEQPVRVKCPLVLPFFLERAGRKLLDDPGQEVLIESHFSCGAGAAARQRQQQ